eukprot:1972819-Amphidinium_carterae.1
MIYAEQASLRPQFELGMKPSKNMSATQCSLNTSSTISAPSWPKSWQQRPTAHHKGVQPPLNPLAKGKRGRSRTRKSRSRTRTDGDQEHNT